MNVTLWIFLAAAFGLMMFASVQDELPDELSFLKSSGRADGVSIELPAAALALEDGTYHVGTWLLHKNGGVVELVKPLQALQKPAPAGGTPPYVGILCDKGGLRMRVNANQPVATNKVPRLTVSGLGVIKASRGEGDNLVIESPSRIFGHMKEAREFEVALPLASGNVTYHYEGRDIQQVLGYFPEACR